MTLLISFRRLVLGLSLAAALGLPAAAGAGELAQVASAGDRLEWETAAPHRAYQLTVGGEGVHSTRVFAPGSRPAIPLFDRAGERLPDGIYTWSLELLPPRIGAAWDPANGRDQKPGSPPPPDPMPTSVSQGGYFRILGGALVVPGHPERATDDRDR